MNHQWTSALRAVLVALATLIPATHAASQATDFPMKPVKIIVGFAPGGGSDIIARVVGQKLGEMWGQPVVVENKPGASGVIGADVVAKAAPDGYTLLVSSATSTAVAATLYPKLPYDVLKDLQIVTVIGTTPSLLVINPSLGPKTLQEFVALARKDPGKVFFGGSGQGSTGHLTGELFNLSLNIKTGHVPYKGEPPALTDVMSGNLTYMFSSLPVVLPLVKAGQLRALAVTSVRRSPAAPEYPTIAEAGVPEFESVAWNALYAPAGVPKAVIQRINADVAKVLQLPDVKERLTQLGVDIVANSPEQATEYLKSETAKWAKVIKAANIRVE